MNVRKQGFFVTPKVQAEFKLDDNVSIGLKGDLYGGKPEALLSFKGYF